MKLAGPMETLLAVGLLPTAALPDGERNEGPLEKAGRKTDEALESVPEKLA